MDRYTNVYVFKLVMLTVDNLVIALNKTRYQFAISVKRYPWFFITVDLLQGVLKKNLARDSINFAIIIFGYIRIPYFKGFPDFNLILTRLKNTVKYDLQQWYEFNHDTLEYEKLQKVNQGNFWFY